VSLVESAYFRVFEPFWSFDAASRKATTRALRAARIGMLPELYLTLSYLCAAGFGAIAWAATSLALAMMTPVPAFPAAVMGAGGGLLGFFVTRLCFLAYPRTVAASRARAIDLEFSSVVTLCYALARGGVNTIGIFRAVGEERSAYGEISVEFEQVIREIDRTGKDLNSALQSVAATTPSETLRAFLDGLVTILSSGAEPRDYFKRQASTQLSGASLQLDKELEQAGLLAESYVSGLLVLPLLLIVVLTVLSVLSGQGATMVILIVFVVIPGGTIAFLTLTEMLMVATPLSVPRRSPDALADFGMSTLPRELLVLPPPRAETLTDVSEDLARTGLEAKAVRRRLVIEWFRRRVVEQWRAFRDRALVRPADALRASAVLAALIIAGGGAFLLWRHASGRELSVGATTLGLAAALVALVPVAIFQEMRVSRAREVDAQLPEVLGRLAGFNEKGVSLLKSFEILGHSTQGDLGNELRGVERDVSWTANLKGALGRLRERVATRRMTKLSVLFERGIGATGNLKEVLEIAAADATVNEGQAAKKRQAMMSYVVVVYVVFAVFLYVIYMVVDLFYGSGGFATIAASSHVKGIHVGIPPVQAQVLFFHASLIQGACCGLVAGKLGEGHILSGIKHAAIMSIIAWLVFVLMVFH